MNGHFSEEALQHFAEMAAQSQYVEFSEEGTYDFTRCVRPNGTAYGTGGKCRKGTEAAGVEKTPSTRSSGSTTFPESKAREIASALAKKHKDNNYHVVKSGDGHKVAHTYYSNSQVNKQVKKHLQEKSTGGQTKAQSSGMTEEKAKQIAAELAKEKRDNNYQVVKSGAGYKVIHAYEDDAVVEKQVKSRLKKS